MTGMERITLSSLQNLNSDYLGLTGQRKRNASAAEGEGANQAPARPAESPVQVEINHRANASPVAADLGQNWPKLTPEQAAQAVDEVFGQVATSTPWKLAEVHDLTERSLVPRPYV